MARRLRLPVFLLPGVLLALIGVLATLQYRWLGRISDAERERLKAAVTSRAAGYAQDFDRELTFAYMLFQSGGLAPGHPGGAGGAAERLATRYERWLATARYPKLIRDCFVTVADGTTTLHRFDPGTRRLQPVAWPPELAALRGAISAAPRTSPPGPLVVQSLLPALWEQVPALAVPSGPSPLLLTEPPSARPDGGFDDPPPAYTLLVLDRRFIVEEMLPALAAQHFDPADGTSYRLAVVESGQSTVLYRSSPAFTPPPTERADASAPMFHVRPHDFPQVAADVRRFTALALPAPGDSPPAGVAAQVFVREVRPGVLRDRTIVTTIASASGGRWQLVVEHPAGSLEAAVGSVRRRNLIISSGILGVLAASLVLTVASTRRAQRLARQQLEFVSAVSHELRTPLAVVRAAGDNLADGIVRDETQVRKYGEVVRTEGRRLTEMVEQILELSGIESGQRGFAAEPLRVDAVLGSVLESSRPLLESSGLHVDVRIPLDLPLVVGDRAALARVFQNLVGNAAKYGAPGGWLGIVAEAGASDVRVTVADRGMGIAQEDRSKIFDPFYRSAEAVAAQIQGAGLGLSLVQRIVQAHRGRVEVKSAPGAGSEFTVVLPAARGAATEVRETGVVPAASSRQQS